MYRISKKFDFSASHQLDGLPEGHQCARLHGHNYQVELLLEAEGLSSEGFVRDYGDLQKFKEWLDQQFDHRHLNDFIVQPTAENIARLMYQYAATLFPEITAVRVSETPKTSAWYMPNSLPVSERILTFFDELAEEAPTAVDRRRLYDALTDLLKHTVIRRPPHGTNLPNG